jgi:RNA polymerase sigma factor (sigma-70 family)
VDESDDQLVARYVAGQSDAFDRLYRRHETSSWRFILRQVRDEAIANDIMQETWFSVASHAHKWQPDAKFSTWLLTIARNKVMDWFRAAEPAESIDAAAIAASGLAHPDALIVDSILGPLRQVQSRELAVALINAVEQLPADQREAFLLQAHGDLSVEEIALATQVSFETAKSRLRYARNKLKSLLLDYPL